jgi:hypothetical protein
MDIIIFYAGPITCKIMYRMCRFIFDVSVVFSKDIFSTTYMGYIKRFCPHSVSILSLDIPAPNPNLFAKREYSNRYCSVQAHEVGKMTIII